MMKAWIVFIILMGVLSVALGVWSHDTHLDSHHKIDKVSMERIDSGYVVKTVDGECLLIHKDGNFTHAQLHVMEVECDDTDKESGSAIFDTAD